MTNNFPVDFILDKKNNTLTFRREFAARRQLVWDCYTQSELLDRWYAPENFSTKTRSIDFRAGGHWHYAMVAPNGNHAWGWIDFITINPIDGYATLSGFCNELGEINQELPRANWVQTFTDKGKNTVVETVITFASLADWETIAAMGMQEGMKSTLACLDILLATLTA